MKPVRWVARALVAALLVAGVLGAAPVAPVGAGTSRAVVVIDTGGSVRAAHITFAGTITGIQALELAGAGPATYGYAGQGLAVCSLDGVGHDANDDCLGTPDDPRYWAYHRAPAGSTEWSYARGGAGNVTVRDGDVEGWRFGTGAAPRLAVCSVADCPPPPPPPVVEPAAPSTSEVGAAGAPAASANPGGAAATPGAGATGTAGSPEAGSRAGGSGDPDGAGAVPTPTTTAPGGRDTTDERDDRRAERALSLPAPDDDGGSGSPAGVLAAVVIVGAIGAAAVVLRRRTRQAHVPPSD